MTDIDTLRRHREALGSLALATYTHADDLPAIAWALAKLDEEIVLAQMGPARMVLCPTCGNKRCPHASHPDRTCTGSNEPGQTGSHP